jgi:pyruvate ferredoxin oxidoreductase beta subunit
MQYKNKNLYPGHNACAGCGQLSAVQSVMRALDKDTILVNATGCLEVTTTAFPQSAWGLPWIHSLFANASSIASGVKTALKNKTTKVVVQAGDGGTYDIGMGQISGMWERNDQVLYICYDTEAYSNTGIQASGSTPLKASTTTTPSGLASSGAKQGKKDMIAIALGHGLKYVAQSACGFVDDIEKKVRKALTISGSSYIQILTPCIPGWKLKSDSAALAGKLAVSTALYPLLEYVDGQLVSSSIKKGFKAENVKEYLKIQGRFKHLKKEDIKVIKSIADYNIGKYSLK